MQTDQSDERDQNLNQDLLIYGLLFILLQEIPLVVEGFVDVLVVDVSPDLLPVSLGLPPLLFLLVQAAQDHGDGRGWVLLEGVNNFLGLVSVEPLDSEVVDDLGGATQVVLEAELLGLLRIHRLDLLVNILKVANGGGVDFNDTIHLVALVLGSEKCVLIGILLRGQERRVFGPDGKGDPHII